MLYLLLGLLVLLFFFSYYFGGKDFFAPMTVQVIGFIFATIACAYYLYSNALTYEFHLNTVLLVASCLAMSVVIGIIAHQMFLKIRIPAFSVESQKITPISGGTNLLVILLLLFTMFWMLAEIRRVGGTSGSFNEIMHNYRLLTSVSIDLDSRLPFVLRQLKHLTTIFFVIYGFNLIRFFKSLLVSEKIINLFVIALCILIQLLGAGRTATVNNIIALVVIFHLLRIQKRGSYKTYSLSFLIKIGLLVLIVLWGFAVFRGFVGRQGRTTEMDAVNYIAYYSGADIVNLDMYLQDPIYTSGVFGKYTFFRLLGNLRSLGADIELYSVHLEYRSIHGISTGNVYTFIRTYFADFGIVGVFVLHGFVSVILSVFYEYVKKRRRNTGILVFSLMYYTVVLSFFAERFFSNIISISFAEDAVLVIIFYKLFLQKKVRFTLGGKRYVFAKRSEKPPVRLV